MRPRLLLAATALLLGLGLDHVGSARASERSIAPGIYAPPAVEAWGNRAYVEARFMGSERFFRMASVFGGRYLSVANGPYLPNTPPLGAPRATWPLLLELLERGVDAYAIDAAPQIGGTATLGRPDGIVRYVRHDLTRGVPEALRGAHFISEIWGPVSTANTASASEAIATRLAFVRAYEEALAPGGHLLIGPVEEPFAGRVTRHLGLGRGLRDFVPGDVFPGTSLRLRALFVDRTSAGGAAGAMLLQKPGAPPPALPRFGAPAAAPRRASVAPEVEAFLTERRAARAPAARLLGVPLRVRVGKATVRLP